MESNSHYPSEESLGKNCMYWAVGGIASGCGFPKAELQGRRSCEGVVDDVCLFIKDGRPAGSLTAAEMAELRTLVPSLDNKSYLPPGATT